MRMVFPTPVEAGVFKSPESSHVQKFSVWCHGKKVPLCNRN